jgi:hypothetical protein
VSWSSSRWHGSSDFNGELNTFGAVLADGALADADHAGERRSR